MKFRPGQLVEIVTTTNIAPDGTAVQALMPECIGKLALVVSYNEKNCLYNVLIGNDEETLEVYEEEVNLVNG